jgi:hypothetical protein
MPRHQKKWCRILVTLVNTSGAAFWCRDIFEIELSKIWLVD